MAFAISVAYWITFRPPKASAIRLSESWTLLASVSKLFSSASACWTAVVNGVKSAANLPVIIGLFRLQLLQQDFIHIERQRPQLRIGPVHDAADAQVTDDTSSPKGVA